MIWRRMALVQSVEILEEIESCYAKRWSPCLRSPQLALLAPDAASARGGFGGGGFHGGGGFGGGGFRGGGFGGGGFRGGGIGWVAAVSRAGDCGGGGGFRPPRSEAAASVAAAIGGAAADYRGYCGAGFLAAAPGLARRDQFPRRLSASRWWWLRLRRLLRRLWLAMAATSWRAADAMAVLRRSGLRSVCDQYRPARASAICP